MGWRGTIVLAGLVLLTAVLYVVTVPEPHVEIPDGTLLGEPRFIDPSKPVKHLIELDTAQVTKLVFGRGDEEITVTKDAGHWRGAADARNLDDFVTSLHDAAELTVIEPGALSDYGLDRPERWVKVEVSNRPAFTLEIGDRNPAGTSAYVRIDDGPVILAGALIVWEFDKAFASVTGRSKLQ